MPMTATMAPYTLFILDDDTPLNPREDHDCLGKMVCWHSRYSLGEKHDYDEPSDFLRNLLFSEYSSGHDRNNPVLHFSNLARPKMPDWNTTAPRGSGNCGRISTGVQTAIGMCPPAMRPR